tara:strand:+ start:48336 stop:48875 length:540 start_codon:yes stop_codon:yes gene_type:complete
MKKQFKTIQPIKQKGAILVTGLILLLVLTLIGVSGMQNVTLTEKMTSNMRDTHLAFQAAESALTDGEQWLLAQTQQPVGVDTCSAPPCLLWDSSTLGNVSSMSQSWWQTQATSYSSNLYGLTSQPQYVLEEFTFVPYELSPEARAKGQGYHYYKVTAKGSGKQTGSNIILESIFATQYN